MTVSSFDPPPVEPTRVSSILSSHRNTDNNNNIMQEQEQQQDPTATTTTSMHKREDQQPPQQEQAAANATGTKNTRPKRPAQDLRQTYSKQKAGGRLSVRDVNWGIPTNAGAQEHVHETKGPSSWQYRLLQKLHSRKVQYFGMALLILDVLIIFTELFLLAAYPSCFIIERDGLSCCPPLSGDGGDAHHVLFLRALAEEGHHELECPDDSLEATDYQAACDPHKYSAVHTAEKVFFGFTIGILSFFFIELHLEMAALTPRIFFKQIFFALDYIVVTISLGLELSFFFLRQQVLQSYIGILVLIRLWRFVRIGHGIIEVTHELGHVHTETLLAYAEALEELLHQHDVPIPESTKAIVHHLHSSSLSLDHDDNDNDPFHMLEAIQRHKREKLRHKVSSSLGEA